MNKQSYLDSKQLQTECNECIKILNSDLLEIEKVSNNIKLVLNETGLKGEAMEAYKKQLRRYFEIFALMKEADKFDIIDYSKLKADATKTYDGDLICTSCERAKNDRDKYQSKANDERSKAASFNTTVTTLLPGGKVLVEHIPNPHESSAREYQKLADDCQKEMNLWHSKMEEFDAIEARTAGLFTAGKNKRTIARLKIRTINKTPISRVRTTLPGGGGIGGLVNYAPNVPETPINEDVLKGAKILEDKLRSMTNEDGNPKYTEKEIQEIVAYVIKHRPYSLSSLYRIPSQYYTNQMDLVLQYALEAKQMIPIDKGAELFANYLRNLKNPDGTPMYTEEEIETMVEYVLEHHPSSLSTLYYVPSQYYRNAVEQCLEYAQETEEYNGNTMVLPEPGSTVIVSPGVDLVDREMEVASINCWSIEYSINGCNVAFPGSLSAKRLNYAVNNYPCNCNDYDLLQFSLDNYDQPVFAGAMVDGFANIGDIVKESLDDGTYFYFLILDTKCTSHTSAELANGQVQCEYGHGYVVSGDKVQLSICEFIMAKQLDDTVNSAMNAQSGGFLRGRYVTEAVVVDHIYIEGE